MPRMLIVSAAVVDVEKVVIFNPVTMVSPRLVQKEDGSEKVSLNRQDLPIITFALTEVDKAKGLLEKIVEVSNYPDQREADAVYLADTNILHVDAPDEQTAEDDGSKSGSPAGQV